MVPLPCLFGWRDAQPAGSRASLHHRVAIVKARSTIWLLADNTRGALSDGPDTETDRRPLRSAVRGSALRRSQAMEGGRARPQGDRLQAGVRAARDRACR